MCNLSRGFAVAARLLDLGDYERVYGQYAG